MATASFRVTGNSIDNLVGAAETHLEQLLGLNDPETKRFAGDNVRSYKFTLTDIRPFVRSAQSPAPALWEGTVEAVLSGWGIPE